MGQISDRFVSTFRPYETDGVPASGAHLVEKSDAQSLGALIENSLTAGRAPYATWAELAGKAGTSGQGAEVLASDAGVHNDPVTGNQVPNAGIYRYEAGPPAGWKWIGASQLVGVASEAAAVAGTDTNTAITPATLLAVDKARGLVGTPIPIGGNLPSQVPLYDGSYLFGAAPAGYTLPTSEVLRDVGVLWQANIVNGGQLYYGVTHQAADGVHRFIRNGDWVMHQVIVEKDPAADWAAFESQWFSISSVPNSGPQQGFSRSATGWVWVEDLDTNIRRYVLGGQFTGITDALSFTILFINNNTGLPIKVGGFAMAYARRRIYDIAWQTWDPAHEGEYGARLSALDGGGGQTEQTTPDMLAPAYYFLVDGRPTELYKAGMTPYRETTAYDFAIAGARGDRGSIRWDDGRQLIIDPARVDAGGAVLWAMKSRADVQPTFRKPITIFRSAAAKAVAFNVLVIGDSLTYRGWASKMKAKLLAAGANPTFIGTFPDITGTMVEGRSSWSTWNYIWQSKAVNVDGSAPIYPIRTGAGNGVTFTYTQAGGVITSITAQGGAGYANTPALPVQISGAGDAKGARATVAITNGVPGAVTIQNGGTGYTGFVDIRLPPSVDEYLALGIDPADFGPRWPYNGFLRPAVGGDPAGNVRNGYIFDMRFYLTRFNKPDPKIVYFALPTNDILRAYALTGPNSIMDAIRIMHEQTRAALPNADIVFCLTGLAGRGNVGWDGCVAFFREMIKSYDGRANDKVWLLPCYQAMDPKLIYDPNVSSTDAYGVQTAGVGDAIHPVNLGIGHDQWGELGFAFAMNRI